MTKSKISDYNRLLDIITLNSSEYKQYANFCKSIWIEIETIHYIIKSKLELINLVWNDEYLIWLYNELIEILPCNKILEILKAHIRIKKILESNKKILKNKKLTELLQSSVIRSPNLLPILENHIKQNIAA